MPLVPEVVEVPAAQPEQLLTASVALFSSVRNQGTGFCIKCYQYFTLLMMKICYSSEHSLLPDGWLKTLPKAGHLWVSQALFITNNKGKAKLDFSR